MTETDLEYLINYKPDTLYVHPTPKGTFVTLIDQSEETLFELDVTTRSKLALVMFHVREHQDFGSFKLRKLRYSRSKWHIDGEIALNGFQLAKPKEFIQLMISLNLHNPTKERISLGELEISSLAAVLQTKQGAELLTKIADNPELTNDIFAIAHKKASLDEFQKLLEEFDKFKEVYIAKYGLKQKGDENVWQHFFENNSWVFGHGLNYVFLDKIGDKLEAVTTGYSHTASGNRVDALMRTKAVISQYVLIEIKTPSVRLLQSKEYRSGCWAVTQDVTSAISQIQKTVFDFTRNQVEKIQVTDSEGRHTGDEIFRIQPKSYLIIGNLSEMKEHDEKFACFQLFRSSLITPEILTYDELYARARCIVETISGNPPVPIQRAEPPASIQRADPPAPVQRDEPEDDDIPF